MDESLDKTPEMGNKKVPEDLFECYANGKRYYVSSNGPQAAKTKLAGMLDCNRSTIVALRVKPGEQLKLSLV